MTTAPVLRSSTLQKSLALPPVKRTTSPTTFAATLAQAKASSLSKKPAAAPVNHAAPGSGAVPFQDLLVAAAKKYGVDPALLAGVVRQESNFNPNAKSGVGAKGLTQLMDATARGLGVSDSFDPAQNVDGGARFLGGLLKQFKGNESLALAAYNAGPGAVQKYGGIPPYQEIQRYVPKVLGHAAQFGRIWAGS